MTDSLIEIRQKAKEMGIKNYAVKGHARLIADMAEANALPLTATEVATPKTQPKKDENEYYYFTNPKTGRIGKYFHTDKKNMIPHTDKGTAYHFVQWM